MSIHHQLVMYYSKIALLIYLYKILNENKSKQHQKL
jgi:hypothetical protein